MSAVLDALTKIKAPRKSRAKPKVDKDGNLKPVSTMRQELEIAISQGQAKRQNKDAPLEIVKDKFFLVEPVGSWADLAKMVSLNLGGQTWVGSNGITHVNGEKTSYVCNPERKESVYQARLITHNLVSQEKYSKHYTEKEKKKYSLEKIPYSVAGCARLLLSWTGCKQPSRELDRINKDSVWQFQHCEPGMVERAYLWDITSCYYSLLCRAPSPYVIFLEGELTFVPTEEEWQLERWKAMLEAVGPHKGLRNSLVGQMFSSGDGLYYFDGKSNKNATPSITELRAQERLRREGYQGPAQEIADKIAELSNRKKKPKPGCLRPLASLIIRCAYELCCMAQYEEKARYANVDCVITANPYAPTIWGRYGLQVALKGSGKAEICSAGNYRVGNFKTKPYSKHKKSEPRERIPMVPNEKAVRLILKGHTWVDKWLTPSEDWEPSIATLQYAQEREAIEQTLKEISKKAVEQQEKRETIELERTKEEARQEQARQEYAKKVKDAF